VRQPLNARNGADVDLDDPKAMCKGIGRPASAAKCVIDRTIPTGGRPHP
jgi:hypothetical protein